MQLVRLGFSCNNACAFCAQGNLRSTEPPTTEEEVRRLLSSVSGQVVAFVGGEPTLYDGLLDWIREAKRAGARSVLVQTNGRRLAYTRYAAALAEAGTNALDISLHGSSPAMHEYHTAVPGSFAQTLTGIAHAREAGMAVGVSVVVTRSNFRHLTDIVRVAHARGATAVHFAMVAPFGRASEAQTRLVPPAELVRPYLLSALRWARSLGMETLAHHHASSESVRDRFAGLGDVAPPATNAVRQHP